MTHLVMNRIHPVSLSKRVCRGLFKCGDILGSAKVWANLVCVVRCLLMAAVPGTVTQPGPKDTSSMASTSEASLSAESRPRIATWWKHRNPLWITSKHCFCLCAASLLCTLRKCVGVVQCLCMQHVTYMCVQTETQPKETVQSIQLLPIVLISDHIMAPDENMTSPLVAVDVTILQCIWISNLF